MSSPKVRRVQVDIDQFLKGENLPDSRSCFEVIDNEKAARARLYRLLRFEMTAPVRRAGHKALYCKYGCGSRSREGGICERCLLNLAIDFIDAMEFYKGQRTSNKSTAGNALLIEQTKVAQPQ